MSEPYEDWLASIADYDQHHAQAIDMLRSAEVFLLAVPEKEDGDETGRIVMTGGGVSFDQFRTAVSAGLNAQAWADIVRWMHRDRWLRRVLMLAASINIIFVVVNFSELFR